jgi:hypothetical protein
MAAFHNLVKKIIRQHLLISEGMRHNDLFILK